MIWLVRGDLGAVLILFLKATERPDLSHKCLQEDLLFLQ